MTPDPASSAPATVVPPPNGMRTFLHVLVNTAFANITTSFLWFALTFWVYLETRSVLATGIIGGAYMLFIAFFAMIFGTLVDRHRKHRGTIAASPPRPPGPSSRGPKAWPSPRPAPAAPPARR